MKNAEFREIVKTKHYKIDENTNGNTKKYEWEITN